MQSLEDRRGFTDGWGLNRVQAHAGMKPLPNQTARPEGYRTVRAGAAVGCVQGNAGVSS